MRSRQILNHLYYNRPTISLCIIAKNEENNLRRIYDTFNSLCSELILVDTGSSDNTFSAASDLGFMVHHYNWDDDFAGARNYSISHAKGDWILIIDPDEYVNSCDIPLLRHLVTFSNIIAYRFITRNYTIVSDSVGFIKSPGNYPEEKDYPGFVPSFKCRLFRNHHNIRFEGCYHEMIDYYLARNSLRVENSPVPVHHYPSELSNSEMLDKKSLYLRLATKKVTTDPFNAKAWWEYATTCRIAGNIIECLRAMDISLNLKYDNPSQLIEYCTILKKSGNIDKFNHIFEKWLCATHLNLTHIDENAKIRY